MKYTALLALGLLFVGCGDETKTTASTHTQEVTKQEVKKEALKVAKEEPKKEENNVAKIPATKAPAPLEKQAKEVVKEVDGKALYTKCQGCHGADGKNKALGKSAPIAGWDSVKLQEAIKGYKNGSRDVYGMGSVMKGQAANLSDEDIKKLSSYISKL
jgi:cytochrome c553